MVELTEHGSVHEHPHDEIDNVAGGIIFDHTIGDDNEVGIQQVAVVQDYEPGDAEFLARADELFPLIEYVADFIGESTDTRVDVSWIPDDEDEA